MELDVVPYLLKAQKEFIISIPKNSNLGKSTPQVVSAIEKCYTNLKLKPTTRYLSIYIMGKVGVRVGADTISKYIIPSILIASKYEEYYPPTIDQVYR